MLSARPPGTDAGARVVADGFTITEAAFARFGGHDVDSAGFSARSTEDLSGYGTTTEGFGSDQPALMDSEYSYVPFQPYAYESYVPYDEPCNCMSYEPFVPPAPARPEFFPPPTHTECMTEWQWTTASLPSSSPSFVLCSRRFSSPRFERVGRPPDGHDILLERAC